MEKFRVSLRSCEFPNTVYPINSYNNKLVVTPNSGSIVYLITLTEGSYTGSTLATHIATQIQAAAGGQTFTGTYDSDTKKITITSNANFAFVLCDNNIYEELGLGSSAFDTLQLTHTSAYPINISGTSYVDLVSNLSSLSYSPGSSNHILARIPVDVSFGSIVFYQNSIPEELEITNHHIDVLTFSLITDKGVFFELPDNAHMSIVLSITPVDTEEASERRMYL